MTTATAIPAIALMPVASSQIAAIGHCPATNTLAIQFASKKGPGSVYHYKNFTADLYTAFAGAESIGSHFIKNIKPFGDKFPFAKVDQAAVVAPAPVPAPPARHQLRDALALLLTGREVGSEITKDEEAMAKVHGLLVIFGASDDLMELRGADCDEFDCYDGGTALIDAKGLLPARDSIDEDDVLKDYFARQPSAKEVEALWCAEEDYSWTYCTDVPHATFEIIEDGLPYCRGIVIDMADLAPAA